MYDQADSAMAVQYLAEKEAKTLLFSRCTCEQHARVQITHSCERLQIISEMPPLLLLLAQTGPESLGSRPERCCANRSPPSHMLRFMSEQSQGDTL